MIRFGISTLPPSDGDDASFLRGLADRGHTVLELPFVNDFPWTEKRCREFGTVAADMEIALSVHAPYFAVLTVEEDDKAKLCVSALEHTMKLGKELQAHTVVAHTGHIKDRDPATLHDLVAERLGSIAGKVRHLGVALGLETAGTDRAFGSLGDIALIAQQFGFVRPVIDWAHVHAKSGGALTTKEAFASVIAFLRAEFPGWSIDPLHTQFTDNEFGPHGEIRHVPYGDGTLRSSILAEAATEAGLRMIVVSEAKDMASHDAILEDLRAGERASEPVGLEDDEARLASSGAVAYPSELVVTRDGLVTVGLERTVTLSNVDKPFFPELTKGDLLGYYRSVAPLLLPHLAGRALSMARYPDGYDGDFFYEKQCPSHAPEWIARAPLHSEHRGEPIEFCMATDTASLLWVINLGCIELHPWLSRVERPENPDFAIFDLDPAEGATWQQVIDTARLINVILGQLGLVGYPKTSGATGIHIYVPLVARYDYRRVRLFVESVGRLVVAADPDNTTMEWDIARRTGKVFIDHNQNVGGKTIAAVYSVRPRSEASVSTPFLWEELDAVEPTMFTVASVWERFRQFGDLFAPVLSDHQELEAAEAALGITVDQSDETGLSVDN